MTEADLMRLKAADIALALMQLCDAAPVDHADATAQFLTVLGNVEQALVNGVDDAEDEHDDERFNWPTYQTGDRKPLRLITLMAWSCRTIPTTRNGRTL